MSFIQFLSGRPRSGKTCLNATFVILRADAGTKVKSNYSIFDKNGKGEFKNGHWTGKKHPNVEIINPYDLVELLEKDRCKKPEIITLQEVYGWFNSHKAFGDPAELEDSFAFQSGKLNYEWYVDTQLPMRVGGALRKMASIRYKAINDYENEQFIYKELDPDVSDQDIETGEESSLPYSIASKFWNRYDTYEKSIPIGYEETKLKMAKTDVRIKNKIIEAQVSKILKVLPKYHVLHYADMNVTKTKDMLMQEGISDIFAPFVCERIKSKLKYNT